MRTQLLKSALTALAFGAGLLATEPFRVQVTGKGQPIILIPGLSSSGETWDTTVARYKDRFECHVLTLSGFAGVPRGAASSEGMLNPVRDAVARYITEHKLAKPVIVGHSLGGYLAIAIAAKYPEIVSRIVIVDAYPFTLGLSPGMTTAGAAAIAAQIKDAMVKMDQPAYEAYVKAGTSTRNLVTEDSDHARLVAWSLGSDKNSVADALFDMFSVDLRPELPKIKVPALVMVTWRSNEQYANAEKTLAAAKEQYAALAGAEIHLNDKARHFIMWDDPQWMFHLVDGFLAPSAKSTQ